MKPMTKAATQAVVTAMAKVSAEYIGGPSSDAPTTGPAEMITMKTGHLFHCNIWEHVEKNVPVKELQQNTIFPEKHCKQKYH